jgi:hypothetical protein
VVPTKGGLLRSYSAVLESLLCPGAAPYGFQGAGFDFSIPSSQPKRQVIAGTSRFSLFLLCHLDRRATPFVARGGKIVAGSNFAIGRWDGPASSDSPHHLLCFPLASLRQTSARPKALPRPPLRAFGSISRPSLPCEHKAPKLFDSPRSAKMPGMPSCLFLILLIRPRGPARRLRVWGLRLPRYFFESNTNELVIRLAPIFEGTGVPRSSRHQRVVCIPSASPGPWLDHHFTELDASKCVSHRSSAPLLSTLNCEL